MIDRIFLAGYVLCDLIFIFLTLCAAWVHDPASMCVGLACHGTTTVIGLQKLKEVTGGRC